MTKSKIILAVMVGFITMATVLSCNKDNLDTNTNLIELRSGGSDGDSQSDCLSNIPLEYRNVNFNYFLRKQYETELFSNFELIKDGSPVFAATITHKDESSRYGITPMRNKASDSITSLLLTEQSNQGTRYKILQRCKVDSMSNSDTTTLTKDDFNELFSLYQCIIDCRTQGGELELRDGGCQPSRFSTWLREKKNAWALWWLRHRIGLGSGTNSSGDNNDHETGGNGGVWPGGGSISGGGGGGGGGTGSSDETEEKDYKSPNYYLDNILDKCDDIITHIDEDLPLDYEDGKICESTGLSQTSGIISSNQYEHTYLWDYYDRCKMLKKIEANCGLSIGGDSSSPLLYLANIDRINGNDANLTFISKNCGHPSMEDVMTLYKQENNTTISFKLFFERYTWINSPENAVIKQHIDNFLLNHPNDKNYTDKQIDNMRNDAEYKALVVSSFGWSSIMWTIAKELVGDKAVDVIIGLIPGFGNADELKDAIKAAKNGDWIEFSFEVGKIVGQNTPWGKMLKIGEAGSDLYIFCKKIEKLMDRIGVWSTAKVEQVWNIVKNSPVRISGDYWKYVDDLAVARFGAPFANFVNYAQKFRDKWEIPQGEIFVHHAVEKQALTSKYPNLGLTEAELNSLENLRGIPASINSEVHLSAIRLKWNNFYTNNPASSITKQKLLDFAKTIDDEYGHLFNPPVR